MQRRQALKPVCPGCYLPFLPTNRSRSNQWQRPSSCARQTPAKVSKRICLFGAFERSCLSGRHGNHR